LRRWEADRGSRSGSRERLRLRPDAEAVSRATVQLAVELEERVTFRVGSARQIEIPRTQYEIVVFSWSL